MVRKVTPSQLKNMIRQAQNKQKQAINKYNQEVRRHNQKVKQAADKYNQEARNYNARVRTYRQKVKNELSKLSRQPASSSYVVFRTSVTTLHESYSRLEHRAETQQLGPCYDHVLDLSEREASNNLEVMNALLGNEPDSQQPNEEQMQSSLSNELRNISVDLDDRWQGAVFSLNPRNPDAARHFCTSAREVITQILELKAPDTEVFSLMPNCDRTDHGKPTRRSKIKFFLHRKGIEIDVLEEFVEKDMDNIVELFRVFNDATHGSAGKFSLYQLSTIKRRVEDGITFLTQLIN